MDAIKEVVGWLMLAAAVVPLTGIILYRALGGRGSL